MDVVLRNVPVELEEHAVAEQIAQQGFGEVVGVTRFLKTARGTAKRLPLARVECASPAQRGDLLLAGAVIGGVQCLAELPEAAADSAAASGRALADEREDEDLLFGGGALLLLPEDSPPALLGRRVLCAVGGRLRRGFVGAVASVQPDGPDGPQVEVEAADATRVLRATRDVVPLVSDAGGSGRLLVVCAETDTYRRAAMCEAGPGDRVLEIGCDRGHATELLGSRGASVVAVDISEQSVLEARSRLAERACADVRVEHIDALAPGAVSALRELAPLAPCGGEAYTHAFIDINGSRDLAAVLRVTALVSMSLAPRVIVVKSRSLHRRALELRGAPGTSAG